MPTTVLQQFAIVGWWVFVVLLMFFAWVCYLRLKKTFTKVWVSYLLDILLAVTLFSYILGLRVFI